MADETKPSRRDEDATQLKNYLKALQERLLYLALGELDIWQAVDREAKLDLKDIFTEGRVSWTPPRDGEDEMRDPEGEKMMERGEAAGPASSTAFAAANDRAVLLGDPGSGKSTYLAMLALCHAGEHLGDSDLNLGLLPDWGKPTDEEMLPLEELVPIHLVLREYAGSELSLWEFFVGTLPKEKRKKQAAAIGRILEDKGGLLLLDGLDEVPEAERCRGRLRESIGEFRESFPEVRILVTSRTYAYQRDGWKLDKFEDARLLPFGEEERSAFLKRWFSHAAPKRGIAEEDAEGRRDRLSEQIEGREHLRNLAENPLLLTLICLHDFQSGGNVPEDREELYSRSVDLLLEIWQKPRIVEAKTGKAIVRLEDYLGVSRDKLQRCLENLALRFHKEQGTKPGLADIPSGEFLGALDELRGGSLPAKEAGGRPSLDKLSGYVEDRTGLISHHGSIYRFAHRTFQEYLAARALSNSGAKGVVPQVREEPRNQWREIYLLAGAKMRKGSDESLWNLLSKSVPKKFPARAKKVSDEDWRMAALAGRLLCETRLLDDVEAFDDEEREIVDRIRGWLRAMVEREALPLKDERLPAAMDLGRIGDPRPGVGLAEGGLPDIVWVPIPTGGFIYQGEPAEIETPFAISRYPITVAQYAAFVADGGYEEESWWTGERVDGSRWDGRKWLSEISGGGFRRIRDPFETPNHPQVGVCWFEAMAFCRWLSERLGMPVRLPHEREWERAAVGGGKRARYFPWGGSEKDESKVVGGKANMIGTRVGHTSPVGLFPGGDARDGDARISDLSGNVWEWCGNWADEDKDVLALRGGSFNDDTVYVRAAIRNLSHAGPRSNVIGFRVVSSPFFPDAGR